MSSKRGTVLALGTFDGVHLGHRAVLGKAVARARALGAASLAMSFRRPPRLFFAPAPGPSLITLPDEKIRLMKEFGVDRVLVLPFGKNMAALTAEAFFQRFVRRRFAAREVVVGHDFRFGRGREGDADFLKKRGADFGIPVHVVPAVKRGKKVVSSGAIRTHLAAGDLSAANTLLATPYFLTGRVVRGDGRGAGLGFPTANLKVSPDKIVPPGVFAVRVEMPGGGKKGGMANVGVRPTLATPDPRPTVEVHIFGAAGSLVGRTLRVSFVRKLREERRFPSLNHLVRQLHVDARRARAALS